MNFSNIEIIKSLPPPVYGVLWVKLEFRSQIKLLSQIRCQIKLNIERIIIGRDIIITDNYKGKN